MPTRFEEVTQQSRPYRMWVEIGEAPDSDWFRIGETLVSAEIETVVRLVEAALREQRNDAVLLSAYQKLAAMRLELAGSS